MLRSHHSTTSVPSGVSLQRVRSIPLSWSKPTGKRFCSTRPPTRLVEFLNNPADKPTIKPTEEVSSDNKPINQQTIQHVDSGVNMASFAEVINNITYWIMTADSLYLRHLIEVLSEAAGRPETQDSTDTHRQRQSQEVLIFTNTECVETGFLFCPPSQSKGHRWALKS